MQNDKLRAASRLRVQDDVLSALRDAIVQGVFAPGEHLRETDIAERLQVSRGPVRQALAVLEHEGLAVIEAHKGARVRPLDRKDVEEVYSLRQCLDGLAARWAVRNATDHDLAKLRQVLDSIALVAETGSPREFTNAELDFHDALYEAAHHERLYAAWGPLRGQVSLLLFSRHTVADTTRANILDDHELLYDLLANRAEEELVAAVDEHSRSAYERLKKLYG